MKGSALQVKAFAFKVIFLLAVLTVPALAQQFSFAPDAGRPLDPKDAFKMDVLGTEGGRVELGWTIAEGYYLYRDHIEAKTAEGTPLAVESPSGQMHEDPNFGTVEVYYNSATITLPRAGGDIAVTWQGCEEDGICYAPVTESLSLPPLSTSDIPEAPKVAPAGKLQVAKDEGIVAGLDNKGGIALVLAAFFGFGIALSLTPCVLPMVPILAGLLSRQGESLTPRRGAVLSGVYILAMATAFAALGAVAGWSGRNLQMVLQSPWAVGGLAALFVVLAMSNFGLFDVKLPAGLTKRLSGTAGRRGSVSGAATLGLTSALIVGPCVTAPLAGAFLYIAQTGNVALGAAALFALGLGQGVPLFLAGTFGSRILPRAGAWMENMRAAFGVLFLVMAVWLLGRILPGTVTLALWAVVLAGVGVFLGGLDRLSATDGAGKRLLRTGGVIALFAGAIMGVGAASGADDPLRPLAMLTGERKGGAASDTLEFARVTDLSQMQNALASGGSQPSLIYVTADWCTTCKGIERSVLPSPEVQAALSGMRLLKADVTTLDDKGQALLDELGAAGPPTMVFLNAEGREASGSRLIGTVRPSDITRSVATTQQDG